MPCPEGRLSAENVPKNNNLNPHFSFFTRDYICAPTSEFLMGELSFLSGEIKMMKKDEWIRRFKFKCI